MTSDVARWTIFSNPRLISQHKVGTLRSNKNFRTLSGHGERELAVPTKPYTISCTSWSKKRAAKCPTKEWKQWTMLPSQGRVACYETISETLRISVSHWVPSISDLVQEVTVMGFGGVSLWHFHCSWVFLCYQLRLLLSTSKKRGMEAGITRGIMP